MSTGINAFTTLAGFAAGFGTGLGVAWLCLKDNKSAGQPIPPEWLPKENPLVTQYNKITAEEGRSTFAPKVPRAAVKPILPAASRPVRTPVYTWPQATVAPTNDKVAPPQIDWRSNKS